jgi:transcriptional regulator with XRE-family HTH domain
MRKKPRRPNKIAVINALPGNTLGERLAKARIEAGLTQKQLARKSGVSDRTIRKCEREELQGLRIVNIKKLAAALNVSPKYLWNKGDKGLSDYQRHLDMLALLSPTKQQRVFKLIEEFNNKTEVSRDGALLAL